MNQRKFIRYSLYFFIPIILGYSVIEYLTYQIPSNYQKNSILLKSKSETIQTLILGSSQLNNAIDASLLEQPTLNLASGNQHHDTDFKLFRALYPFVLSNLKTVILEVSYSHFELPHNGKNFWKNSVFLKYYQVNCFERKTYFKDKLIYLSYPEFFSKKLVDFYYENKEPALFNEFGFNTTNYYGQFMDLKYDETKIAKVPRFKINLKEDLKIFNTNTTLFFEILDEFKSKKINVIICSTPVYKTYLPKRNSTILIRRDSILNLAVQRYDNVSIFNKEEDTTNFGVYDYWNQSHLNPDGARKFTKMLNSELLKTN